MEHCLLTYGYVPKDSRSEVKNGQIGDEKAGFKRNEELFKYIVCQLINNKAVQII